MKKIFYFFSLFFVITIAGCDQLNSFLTSITLASNQTNTTTSIIYTTTTTSDRTNEIIEIFDSINIESELYIYNKEEQYEILTVSVPNEANIALYISLPNVIVTTNCKGHQEISTYKTYTFSLKFNELITEDTNIGIELFIRDESIKTTRFNLSIINKSEN